MGSGIQEERLVQNLFLGDFGERGEIWPNRGSSQHPSRQPTKPSSPHFPYCVSDIHGVIAMFPSGFHSSSGI